MFGVRCWMFDVSLSSIFSITRTRTISKNNKSPPDLSVEQGQMGDGSAPVSLSRAGIRRHPFGGCRLPDAILHGKRSYRPRGRAVQHLAAAGFRVRLFSPLGLVVAPPGCEPGQDTPATFFRVLALWRQVSRRFLRRVRPTPRVSPLHSQAAFCSQSSDIVFNIAGARKVFMRPAQSSCPSRRARSLCPPFSGISLGGFI